MLAAACVRVWACASVYEVFVCVCVRVFVCVCVVFGYVFVCLIAYVCAFMSTSVDSVCACACVCALLIYIYIPVCNNEHMKLYILRIYMQTYMKQITIPDNVLSSTPAKCPLNAEISKGSHRLLSFPDSETSLTTSLLLPWKRVAAVLVNNEFPQSGLFKRGGL